ncbi:MAG: adenylate kinase family protein [Gemmatimonadales bacterium]
MQAKAVMEAGRLVSDDIILGVIREELAKPTAANGVIFDGVMRTIPQAEGVAALLSGMGQRLDHVLFFDVPDAQLVERLAGRRAVEGRADDDPASVERRLEAYRAQTAPLIDWYASRGNLTRIDAVGSVDDVFGRVTRALGS